MVGMMMVVVVAMLVVVVVMVSLVTVVQEINPFVCCVCRVLMSSLVLLSVVTGTCCVFCSK